MKKAKIALVTGMSGAGKTTAMGIFENMGYQCIDNYPTDLLTEFLELIPQRTIYNKVAMAVSLNNALKAIKLMDNIDWVDVSVVFLDCDDETLIRRYKETRRAHPMSISGQASTLSEAIVFERNLANSIIPYCDLTIDTTKLSKLKFQNILEQSFDNGELNTFRITFMSFGYKHGVPKDVDLLLDVRFLPNPFYIPALRNLTGNDPEVYNFVMDKAETQEFIDKTVTYFDYLFSQYHNEGKMHVIVGIGCTGGQHRSVTLANYFYNHYKKVYPTYRLHRDALTRE